MVKKTYIYPIEVLLETWRKHIHSEMTLKQFGELVILCTHHDMDKIIELSGDVYTEEKVEYVYDLMDKGEIVNLAHIGSNNMHIEPDTMFNHIYIIEAFGNKLLIGVCVNLYTSDLYLV